MLTLAVRLRYVRRLLPGVRYIAVLAPSVVPVVVATAATLLLRLVLWGGGRTLAQALVEAAVFLVVYTAAALHRERSLLGELTGALRGDPAAALRAVDPADAVVLGPGEQQAGE